MRSFYRDRLGTIKGETQKQTVYIYKWRASFATMQHSFHLCPPELTMVVSFQIFFVDRQGKREEELFSLSPVRHRPTPAIAAARPARQETPLFFSVSLCLSRACLGKRVSFLSLSLCLSRACLGKRIVFIYKWLKKEAFFAPGRTGRVASLRPCSQLGPPHLTRGG